MKDKEDLQKSKIIQTHWERSKNNVFSSALQNSGILLQLYAIDCPCVVEGKGYAHNDSGITLLAQISQKMHFNFTKSKKHLASIISFFLIPMLNANDCYFDFFITKSKK
jgi:hypothetical protein